MINYKPPVLNIFFYNEEENKRNKKIKMNDLFNDNIDNN